MCEFCVKMGFMTQEDLDKQKSSEEKMRDAVQHMTDILGNYDTNEQMSIVFSIGMALMMENKIPPFAFVNQIKMAIDATWQNYNEERLSKLWAKKREREKLHQMDNSTEGVKVV